MNDFNYATELSKSFATNLISFTKFVDADKEIVKDLIYIFSSIVFLKKGFLSSLKLTHEINNLLQNNYTMKSIEKEIISIGIEDFINYFRNSKLYKNKENIKEYHIMELKSLLNII